MVAEDAYLLRKKSIKKIRHDVVAAEKLRWIAWQLRRGKMTISFHNELKKWVAVASDIPSWSWRHGKIKNPDFKPYLAFLSPKGPESRSRCKSKIQIFYQKWLFSTAMLDGPKSRKKTAVSSEESAEETSGDYIESIDS